METGRTYILGVDPGTTTGLALLMVTAEGRPLGVWSGELAWEEARAEIRTRMGYLRAAAAHGHSALAAGEMYQINSKTGQRGQRGSRDAMGMLGVLRQECDEAGVELVLQQASSAKKMPNNTILRAMGLYTPNMRHARDAYRHAVLLGVRRGVIGRGWLLGGVRAP